MMLSQSRIAIATATLAIGVWLMMMPAHSQTSDTVQYREPPLDHPIGFYRDLVSKAAKQAIQKDSAETEIVVISPPEPEPEGRVVISENPHYNYRPYACGYVTPLRNRNRQRFIYYFSSDKAMLFASLRDKALVDAMARCGFLPRSPWPPPDEYFWGNLNLKY